MRFASLTLVLFALPALAHAHAGHLAGLAGHDHWVAGAAIGTAIAIGLWTAAKGRGRAGDRADAEPQEDGEAPEGQEA